MNVRSVLVLFIFALTFSCAEYNSEDHRKIAISSGPQKIDSGSSLHHFISSLSQMEFNLIYSGELRGSRLEKWENAIFTPPAEVLQQTLSAVDKIVRSEFSDTLDFHIPQQLDLSMMDKALYNGKFHFTIDSTIYLGESYLSLTEKQKFELLTHEIFHIISRYSPSFRKMIYSENGLFLTEKLQLPDSISNLKRKNPDLPHQYFIGNLRNKEYYTTICTLDKRDCNSYSECSQCEIYKVDKTNKDSFILRQRIEGKHDELLQSKYSDYNLSEIHPEEILAEYMTNNLINQKMQ